MSCMGHMRNMVVHLMKAAGRPAAFLRAETFDIWFIDPLFYPLQEKLAGIAGKFWDNLHIIFALDMT